jgi:putative hemolysin
MFKKISFFTLFCLTASALFLTACAKENESTQTAPSLANPASTYCQGLGFTEETRQNEAGEYGVCVFPDGTECDSWDFLAGRCGQENSYCLKQGFTLQSNMTNIATCQFDDGTVCDEFAYFQGECKPGENKP